MAPVAGIKRFSKANSRLSYLESVDPLDITTITQRARTKALAAGRNGWKSNDIAAGEARPALVTLLETRVASSELDASNGLSPQGTNDGQAAVTRVR